MTAMSNPHEHDERVAAFIDAVTTDRLVRTGLGEGVDLGEREDLLTSVATGMVMSLWGNVEPESPSRAGKLSTANMMRANMHTAHLIHQVLAAEVGDDADTARILSGWVTGEYLDIVELILLDRTRPIQIGDQYVRAGQLLGRAWDRYAKDLTAKVDHHVQYGKAIGFDTLAVAYGLRSRAWRTDWFPSTVWDDVIAVVKARTSHMARDEEFWQTVTARPWALSDMDANWLLGCDLASIASAIRAARAVPYEPASGGPKPLPVLAVRFLI